MTWPATQREKERGREKRRDRAMSDKGTVIVNQGFYLGCSNSVMISDIGPISAGKMTIYVLETH